MKLKQRLIKLLDNNTALKIISVIVAIVVWFIVAISIDPIATRVVTEVPINIDVFGNDTQTQIDLRVVSGGEQTVNVVVKGKRYVIGSLSADNIEVTGNVIASNEAGVYNVELTAKAKNGNSGFEIEAITPSRVQIRVDRIATKKLVLEEKQISGVEIEEGYILADPVADPAEITLTGPQSELDKVEKAVIVATGNGVYDSNFTLKGSVQLLDAESNVVDSDLINIDHEEVQISVNVLKVKSLPLKVNFINTPEDFSPEDLNYTLSATEIKLAAPKETIDSLSSFSLGYIDFKQLDVDSTFTMKVNLPTGFVNVSDLNSVEVKFNTSNWSSKYFQVTNIRAVNAPDKYDITVNTMRINNVKLVGLRSVINTLASSDIVAEIDLASVSISTSQVNTVPVRIVVPGRGYVWAYGQYTVLVTAKAR